MTEQVNKLTAPFMALPPGRRWVVGIVIGLSLLGFGALITLANRVDYKPLYANLGNDDAGEIVKKLKEQKVPHRLASDGRAILVPADKVYDLRLSLASEGLPQGGGVGFEIFDRKNFGMTEFVQKLNFQRALQGELSRTIMQISGVEHARVHLAIPEKSIYKDTEKLPTASVVLRMKSGRQLRESEVQGISHLVSSSVEGLDLDHVTVLDSRGKVMSRTGPSDTRGKMTATMMETQRSYEKNMEERLQSLLDKAVGSGKSAARVSATLDFKQVEKTEERFDPEATAVKSEQRGIQKDGTSIVSASIPGAQANSGKAGTSPTASGGGSRSDETVSYEVSRSTSKTIEPVGALAKLSVAILVDGKYETAAAAKGGKPEKPRYIPRSPEELQKIEALVKSAVGYNLERGDQLTVVNVPLQDVAEDGVIEAAPWWEKPIVMEMGKNGLLGIGFIALIMLVLRPLLKTLTPQKGSRDTISQFGINDGQTQLDGMGRAALPQIGMKSMNQMELADVVRQDPYQTAQILRSWLGQKE
ncbi:MAG: flagellar M-ring protein FliF [Deltaproteobacteria bacterium]|nr:flagellar M-ring protein FliF [Deltaproteobacteria bacterium]